EAFDLHSVGRLDDFFELGGDSLIATVITARVHEVRGVALDFGAFVDRPVLKDLAAFVDEMRPAAVVEDDLRIGVTRETSVPASAIQEFYWSTSRVPMHSLRHTRAAQARIEGSLDPDILRQSLNDVAARHDILRTRFEMRDGSLMQVVQPRAEV